MPLFRQQFSDRCKQNLTVFILYHLFSMGLFSSSMSRSSPDIDDSLPLLRFPWFLNEEVKVSKCRGPTGKPFRVQQRYWHMTVAELPILNDETTEYRSNLREYVLLLVISANNKGGDKTGKTEALCWNLLKINNRNFRYFRVLCWRGKKQPISSVLWVFSPLYFIDGVLWTRNGFSFDKLWWFGILLVSHIWVTSLRSF